MSDRHKICSCGRSGLKLNIMHDRITLKMAEWMRVIVWTNPVNGAMSAEYCQPNDPVPDICPVCAIRESKATQPGSTNPFGTPPA